MFRVKIELISERPKRSIDRVVAVFVRADFLTDPLHFGDHFFELVGIMIHFSIEGLDFGLNESVKMSSRHLGLVVVSLACLEYVLRQVTFERFGVACIMQYEVEELFDGESLIIAEESGLSGFGWLEEKGWQMLGVQVPWKVVGVRVNPKQTSKKFKKSQQE